MAVKDYRELIVWQKAMDLVEMVYRESQGGLRARCTALVAAADHVLRGDSPKMCIALCGYEGEHNALEGHGWNKVAWKAHGGYANQGNGNRHLERIWFSPACLPLQSNDASESSVTAVST